MKVGKAEGEKGIMNCKRYKTEKVILGLMGIAKSIIVL